MDIYDNWFDMCVSPETGDADISERCTCNALNSNISDKSSVEKASVTSTPTRRDRRKKERTFAKINKENGDHQQSETNDE